MNRRRFLQGAAASPFLLATAQTTGRIDLAKATIVVRPGELPNAEKTAATVLSEEIAKRTGIQWNISTTSPASGAAIAITSVPSRSDGPESRPDGYRIRSDKGNIRIEGADARGALFGVGRLLRELDWSAGGVSIPAAIDIATAPAYAIRGHQLGYRPAANSYDAWDAAQFERYIRELTFFGVNSIEGIPFQDTRPTPVMTFSRREMNRSISEIYHRYGLDYWLWLPAEFDLREAAPRKELLDRCDELFHDCPEVSGIFFPGGDPGNNPPEQVLPFLEDLSRRMLPIHPKARIWLSLQWFTPPQIDFVYQYIERTSPAWFAGLVAGPSGPPIAASRQRLPSQFKLRLYPDITHNKLCQYQVHEWDQAYALTLGREAVNPRPAEYARIHDRFAPYSDGFISYSDGVHDDVNKNVFSALSWDPTVAVRDILIDYARVHFRPAIAEETADAILALERNWHGALVDNGAVEGTLIAWQGLERRASELSKNWRWQMCLLRATYDAYVRRRLIRETNLELQANDAMLRERDVNSAITVATQVLNRAVDQPTSPELRNRIFELCDGLYHSIGLQTSVPKYYAIGEERGAVLDFVDYPLNNRWWLEDEFAKIRAMSTEPEKRDRLRQLATWENPGPGSFYDDIGNIARSPHVVRTAISDASVREPEPTFWWWDEGKSRARISWQVTMWPIAVVYEALDPNGAYMVRSSGFGQALLRINGELMAPTLNGKSMGEFKEFPVPSNYVKNGKLTLTWDRPKDEANLNWRNKSRLAEVWLVKRG